MTETSDEDRKLVTLARGAMGRAGTGHGAAVRDVDGRTYAGAPVALASLALTGLQVAVATALSSGAEGFEAAVIVGATDGTDPGAAALHEVSPGAPILLFDARGEALT
ncbi:cytidine deaminase [Tsukamurella paurometabola]|uniref:Cytidine deaminase n=1 Tax=Tsukamurella paurometabola TaxID=2061 RepID=A0ABS5N9Y1_TSUPA|nr:cytidine deaminase [Tsukamurella paurometabola]MBS4101049.1 cytidine deaminase [Tsukamurella paurometabola]